MRRKILVAALGTVLFLGCSNTTARAPAAKWKPDPTTFKPFPTYTIIEQRYIDYEATPRPTRAPLHVPKPLVKSLVKPYKAPRSHVKLRVVSASTSPKRYALSRVGAAQFSCLNNLWTKESNWNYRAYNRHSGAYGIPQALPGNKMATFGSDWRTNPITQVKWGLHYVNGRYGSSCGAWNHWKHYNWY